jgi:hypothetical protein
MTFILPEVEDTPIYSPLGGMMLWVRIAWRTEEPSFPCEAGYSDHVDVSNS